MSGLRVGHEGLLARGMSLPGLARRASALAQLPPLGLLTIAGTAPLAWDVDLISDDGIGDESDLADQILAQRPDVVAFSCLTPAADRAARVSELIRRRGPRDNRVITVIGGLHATAAPEHCQPHFDVVTTGDGEVTLPKLLSVHAVRCRLSAGSDVRRRAATHFSRARVTSISQRRAEST